MFSQTTRPDRAGITWEESVSRMWENVHGGADRNVPYDSTIMEQTPDAMLDMGFPDLPWAHDWKNLRRECTPQSDSRDIRNHGIPFDVLVRLPALLSEPVAAYIRPQYRNRVNLVLDAESEMGVPVVACMSMNGTYRAIDGMQRPCVRVLTVHGRNNIADNLEMSGKAGLLVSADIPRLLGLFSRCGIAMPKGLAGCAVNPDAFPHGSCWSDEDIDRANAEADMEVNSMSNSRDGHARRGDASPYLGRNAGHGRYGQHQDGNLSRDATFVAHDVSEDWNEVMSSDAQDDLDAWPSAGDDSCSPDEDKPGTNAPTDGMVDDADRDDAARNAAIAVASVIGGHGRDIVSANPSIPQDGHPMTMVGHPAEHDAKPFPSASPKRKRSLVGRGMRGR